jgi:hypothetical protein
MFTLIFARQARNKTNPLSLLQTVLVAPTSDLHNASPRVRTMLTAAVEKCFAVFNEPKKQAGVDEHRIVIDIHAICVFAGSHSVFDGLHHLADGAVPNLMMPQNDSILWSDFGTHVGGQDPHLTERKHTTPCGFQIWSAAIVNALNLEMEENSEQTGREEQSTRTQEKWTHVRNFSENDASPRRKTSPTNNGASFDGATAIICQRQLLGENITNKHQ